MFFVPLPLIALLSRHVMMMHVMFMDVNFMDKWRDHNRNVMCKIVRVDVPLVSCPAHVAPGVTAAVYIYLSAGRYDRLDLMARRGAQTSN